MSKVYCAAPWRGLHINPRGDVKTCCAGDPNMLGNLNEHNIEQILHGPVMQEIRQTLRQGRMHPEFCQNCIQAERYGRSERDWHNRLNPGFDPGTVSDQDHQPVLIDVRWNITCNLSCNYCGDKCSSKWADLKGVPVRSGTRPYIEQVCEYLANHQHSIRQVALVGGEPLLLKENESVLDVTPDSALVNLITNLSVDLDTNRIFQRLAQRPRVGWNVSFDNVGSRFEYVRYGGRWDLIESNIQRIRQCVGHEIGIHAVYNVYNATRLEEFVAWAKSQQLDIHWQSLFQPEYLDPLQLGPDIQKLALQELHCVLARADLSSGERGFLEQARKNLEQAKSESLIQQFKSHIVEIESTYHPDQVGKFAQLWPELSTLL
jgi:radical SAM protein with 4Fe4S-binding SPASM domain